jgi:hypothetical protein
LTGKNVHHFGLDREAMETVKSVVAILIELDFNLR